MSRPRPGGANVRSSRGGHLRLGLQLGYSGAKLNDATKAVQEAERLGYDSIWTAEAYGSDAITPLTWYAARTDRIKLGTAVMQMPARTPATTAMTVATLDSLSGGRVICGLGLSGPQVAEGFHGVPFGRPLVRTREYVEIVRAFLKREEPVTYDGREYQLPNNGEGSTGLGKPLRLILHPVRDEVPIYLGAQGPKNLELAGEIADGWLPLWISPFHMDMYLDPIRRGLERSGRTFDDLDVAVPVTVIPGEDISACAAFVKPVLALYVGGMGAKGRNFHYDAVCRFGYESAAVEIEHLYSSGDKMAAAAAVPTELCDEIALLGPWDRIKDRLGAWRDAGVDDLLMPLTNIETLRRMTELVS